MSDRVGEPQIEDVLGSIRRLTADVPARPATQGKLVLTQAQRVYPDAPARAAVSGDVHDQLAPIDEQVLRELVRELLTEEMQGPLGEKITRNVRKMVRAEIGRALAERELR